MRSNSFRAVLIFLIATLTVGCSSMKPELRTVPHVDLPRYMGDWHVIANIPYFAEQDCFDSVESYALREDGDIHNWFACRKGSFTAPMKRKVDTLAKVVDKATNARWRVRFFKVISVQYLIIDLDPQYQWVVVGHPSRRYGWIMARSRTLDPDLYRQILGRLGEQGYDPGKFAKVPQNDASPQ